MKRMRIVSVITALVVVGVVFLVNFIRTSERNERSSLKVGFVYDGDESAPYTNNFIKAQKMIDEYDFGGRVTTVAKSNISKESGEQAIKELIDEGCDMIFTTSYGYGESAKKLAESNPDIQFCEATCDNANTDPILLNYHTFMGEIYQGRYVSGIVAGMKLKEMIDKGEITEDQALVGYVGAFPYAEVISGYTAFILGVRSVVPSAVMNVRYTDTWTDYTLEKECAKKLIDEGCVIISQHSDTAGPAVACEEASEDGKTVYHVGYNQSMMNVAPTTSLISTRIDWSKYIFGAVKATLNGEIIEEKVDGNVHGNDIGAGFELDWVQVLEINTLIAPKDSEKVVSDTIEKLKNKQIKVFKGNYKGVNPYDEKDVIDLKNGFEENANASAPSFHYILEGVVKVEED